MIHDDLLARLRSLPASADRDAFVDFVSSRGDAALRRDGGAEHITASCVVFTPDLDRTLLCFHRKGRFWVQFGGHVETGDATVADAARREAREESGVDALSLLSDAIVELDRHELSGGFACAAHWDVRFVALADAEAALAISDESDDVRWFRLDTLPDRTAPRLAAALDAARAAAARISGAD